jgi:hypothetical protein
MPHLPRNSQSHLNTSHPVTIATSTNEVAMWALQLYICLIVELPLTILGALGVHFLIHLHPRDQHPVIYIMTVHGPLFILSPWDAIFSYPDQARMRTFKIIKYMLIYSILVRYCSCQVFGFHVCRYLVIVHQHNPFRYILITGM